MPVYRMTLVYQNQDTGLSWSVTNYRSAVDPPAAKALMNAWNTAACLCMCNAISLVGAYVSDVNVYRDKVSFAPTSFTSSSGSIVQSPIADSLACLIVLYGTPANQSNSHWWLHGLNSVQCVEDTVPIGDANFLALDAASFAYFYQYRPGPPGLAGLPLVDPPQPFGSHVIRPTLYVRRLGRPFSLNGQTRRYR